MKPPHDPENVAVEAALACLNKARKNLRRGMSALAEIPDAEVAAAMEHLEVCREMFDSLEHVVVHTLEKCTTTRAHLNRELARATPPNPDNKPFPDGWMGLGKKDAGAKKTRR